MGARTCLPRSVADRLIAAKLTALEAAMKRWKATHYMTWSIPGHVPEVAPADLFDRTTRAIQAIEEETES